ncbi:mitochondrial protein required for respiration [Heliocybe sulcata]|uniref:SURF1-like protein n=1 Tax=Heliocybe sulcata TaxID=5364 RepID=A0A5C3NIN3_9AGAM|nr:mitochondrial protein required for respiration [Heliocybe sulcata]
MAYSARRISLFTPTMAVLAAVPVVTFCLGTWQLKRLKWKVALIDELEEKLQREPISLPRRINVSVLPEFTYRKVVLQGRWDTAHSILLGPRVRDGENGYHLVTPLIRSEGTTILVNRGFVSKDFAEQALREQAPDEEVEVLGMLRTSQARNSFTPDNNPERGEWYWTDVDVMTKHAGGEAANVQPVFVEEIFEGHAGEASWRQAHGVPIGRLPLVDLRNSHLSYLVTWSVRRPTCSSYAQNGRRYSLSAFTTFLFLRLMAKNRRAHVRMPRT